jgi:microcystin-dependent protein
MQPFLAEIRMFGFNFAPRGWALCNGQLFAIQQATALFSLIGVNYGGNGTTNFALPNLQGLVPLHAAGAQPGPGQPVYSIGETGGSTSVSLGIDEMAVHNHQPVATTTVGTVATVSGNQVARARAGGLQASTNGLLFSTATPTTLLAPQVLLPTGGGLPHNNVMPTMVVNFCIALEGVFPTRN